MKINPAATVQNLGGKGYQLTCLAKNFPVPPFFVIALDDITELQNKENQTLILNTFDKHKFETVSVRSSATVEDSNSASFAGMFETELNVTRETLIINIEKILQSADNTRVKEYCKINKIDVSSIKMRIVIQKMIASRIAGVCLTRDKIDGDMLIEAVLGLGEALVSGLVSPDTYTIDRKTLEVKQKSIGYQKTLVSDKGEAPVPFFMRNTQKMTDDEIKQLGKICLQIEQHYKYKSADIEWAFEGDKLYILQSRAFVGL